jgi:hypothetical protein
MTLADLCNSQSLHVNLLKDKLSGAIFYREPFPCHFNAQTLKYCQILTNTDICSKSKSHCDWRSVSKSWCRAPSGTHDQIFITIEYYGFVFCRASSPTRGRVCLLYVLMVLASAVFLVSESLGTCDHILLSQIWDFPFCCLLRLAGSRWRYSTPPPHG